MRSHDLDSHSSRMSQRTWLIHRNLDTVNPGVFKTNIGDFADKALDEHRLSRTNMGDDLFRDRAVVDRVIDVIRTGGTRGVGPHHNIDADVLLVDTLIGIDPDDAANKKIGDEYLVKGHGGREYREPEVRRRNISEFVKRTIYVKSAPPSRWIISPVMKSFFARNTTVSATTCAPPACWSGTEAASALT
jgi:hypothetical protein